VTGTCFSALAPLWYCGAHARSVPALSRRAGRPALHALLAACGGFLLATLWLDLMFDVEAWGHAGAPAPLPEAIVASIAAYYRRVTTEAHPMQRLIAAVMLVTLAGSVWTIVRSPRRPLAWTALLTAAAPIGYAAARVFPDAVRLGTGAGSLEERTVLARSILAGHVLCLASIAAFTTIQLVLALRDDGDA
jgi:hypothetical protein